ncbi:MAG: sporulation protein YqfC [Ruminococcaceae bacterium]|nr:sporulation protein YqfC [Oscillospiraceae bacterium]
MKKRMGKRAVSARKSKKEQLSGLLDIPLDMVADVPHITMNDNRELSIENYKSIEVYEPVRICLRCKTYCIVITGNRLEINAITDEEILIHGDINSLSFL